ncbi:MAG: flagellar type III secretion system pore protein FliP [Actinomycetota bacterium]
MYTPARPRPGWLVATLMPRRQLHRLIVGLVVLLAVIVTFAPAAGAQDIDIPEPTIPELPLPSGPGSPATDTAEDDGAITIDIAGGGDNAGQPVVLIIGLAILSLAPSLILMVTSFTRIIIVFSLTRNALGLQTVPPNQVLIGLALFLSLFVMGPTIDAVNEDALQPYLDGDLTQEEAFERATGPIKEFMLAHTDGAELEMILDASNQPRPESVDDIGLSALIPAFLLSEIKAALIIGFIIFIPFVIIDIVVAASLMALGMMMLPPVFVSLPFKLLLFIMIGGWSLVVETLLASYL